MDLIEKLVSTDGYYWTQFAPSPEPPLSDHQCWHGYCSRQYVQKQFCVVHKRIDETNRLLNDGLKETNRVLGARIDETNKRIDETNRVLSEQIRAVHKRMDTYFLWMMGTLVAITGVLIAVIKL